jgi:hypothetical protein
MEGPGDVDAATVVPEPARELAAMVGEPAGEPWPAHDASGNDDAALASNGVRRGLFGR